MRVLSFSDIHIDATTAGKPRRAEVLQFLKRVRMHVQEYKPELVLFGGDAHDSGWLLDPLYSADLIREFFAFQTKLVAVAGNHDVVYTSELFDDAPLTTLTPLRAAASLASTPVWVLERPETVRVAPGWAVLALPYVAKAHQQRNAQWLDKAFADARALADEGWRLIVLGHMTIPGAKLGSESAEMAKGQDQLFPFERVAALKHAIALVLNGHYHAQQWVRQTDFDIVIPGSSVRFTFGEIDQRSKGIFLGDLD